MTSLRLLPDGVFTDLLTPFREGCLDLEALRDLLTWQMQSGIAGIVVCGENGEAQTLAPHERRDVIRTTVDTVNGAVPVLVGTGTNCTYSTVLRTREAKDLGADAALMVMPYYSKPCQEGLFRHVQAVSEAIDLPLLLLNAPDRTAVTIGPMLYDRLAMLPTPIGFVDAGVNESQACSPQRTERGRLRHYCGHDGRARIVNLIEGHGMFSLAANIAPRIVVALYQAARFGNAAVSRELQDRLHPLLQALDREHPVAAAKYALSQIRAMDAEVRLPLVAVEPDTASMVNEALAQIMNSSRMAVQFR